MGSVILIAYVMLAVSLADSLKQVDHITQKLRCLVCQNESVFESNTFFSASIKQQVYEQVKQGMDESSIFESLRLRYGDAILFEPAYNATNFLLWFLPVVFFLIVLYKVYRMIRQ